MVLLIDNYDSFTYNLVHYFETLGADMKVVRNDAATSASFMALSPKAAVISPGPSSPKNAGICVDFIRECAGKIPLFGVCLGMQSIGYAFGGEIVSAKRIMHGKTSSVSHDSTGVFAGMPNPIEVVRYHSLAVAENSLPPCLRVTARAEDGEVGDKAQGFPHRGRAVPSGVHIDFRGKEDARKLFEGGRRAVSGEKTRAALIKAAGGANLSGPRARRSSAR